MTPMPSALRGPLQAGTMLVSLAAPSLWLGCARPNVLPPPRFVSIAAYEDEAEAYRCQDEYELVEDAALMPEGPVARVEHIYSGDERYVVTSGDERYEVRLPSTDAGPHRWVVTRDGAPTVELGEDASPLIELAADGRGGFVAVWNEQARPYRGASLVHPGGVLPIPIDRHLGWRPLRLLRSVDGWWIVSRGHEATMVARLHATGVVTPFAALGLTEDVVVAEHNGGLAIVWRDEAGLQFRSGDVERLVVPAEPGGGWLRPMALVGAADGYWLVVVEDWIDAHYVASPAQLRVFHIGLDGVVLGDARTTSRWVESASARVDDGVLHVRLAEWGGPRGLALAPRECGAAPTSDACAPRTWRPGAAALVGHHWDRDGDSVHYRAGSDVSWTLAVEGSFLPLLDERSVAGLTRDAGRVRLVELDPRTGAVLRERDLGEREISAACATDDLRYVALAGEDGATLLDEDGQVITQVEGAFTGCALAVLRERVVWALQRIRVVSSAGPMTTMQLVVLSGDGHDRLAELGSEHAGRDAAFLVTDDGAWLGWTSLGLEHYWVWPLADDGVPVGEPRRIADTRLFPATTLAMTELGPSLLWSSSQEEGVVPLCHDAEGPAESALMSATFPVAR